MISWELLATLASALVLSAACGFRVFTPPLFYVAAARLGIVIISPDLKWIQSNCFLQLLIFAALIEIFSYMIPWLDNALDFLATPAALAAGVLLFYVSVDFLQPEYQWLIAAVSGASASFAPQLATVSLRAGSSGATLGIANPLLSLAEDLISSILAIVAILAPLAALGIVIFTVLWALLILRKILMRKLHK